MERKVGVDLLIWLLQYCLQSNQKGKGLAPLHVPKDGQSDMVWMSLIDKIFTLNVLIQLEEIFPPYT